MPNDIRQQISGVTDSELLRRYVAGSEEAFGQLFSRHRTMVIECCRRVLGGDDNAARDAAQGVFLVLEKKAGELLDYRNLGTWLYRVSQYVAVNERRKVLRRREVQCELDNVTAENATAPKTDSEILWDKASERLDEVVQGLPAKLRDVLVMHYFQRMSFEDIAQVLGRPAVTIRVWASRARERTRSDFAKKGIILSLSVLTAGLEAEAGELSIGDLGFTIGENADVPEGIRNTADAVMTEMDRAAAKAMWGWIGVGAAGVATIGVGAALVVSHLHSAAVESATSWWIESVVGAPIVRRVETMQMLKAGDVLCAGDRIVTASNQEVQVTSDTGDRILVREEGDVRFEHPTLNTEHRTSKLREGDSQVRVVCGAIVAELKSPVHFATPHAVIQSDPGAFFLMVASGLTSNRVPWSFSRLDVTEGQVLFRSSGTQVSSSEFPTSPLQFAAVGIDCEGKTIVTAARTSDGREMSPKYGGVFFKEYADMYETTGFALDRTRPSPVPWATFTAGDLFKRIERLNTNLDVRMNEAGKVVELRNAKTNEVEAIILDLADIGILRSRNGVTIQVRQTFRMAGTGTAPTFTSTGRMRRLNMAHLPSSALPTLPESLNNVPVADGWRSLRSYDLLPVGASPTGLTVYETRHSFGGSGTTHLWEEGVPSLFGIAFRCAQIEVEDIVVRELTRTN